MSIKSAKMSLKPLCMDLIGRAQVMFCVEERLHKRRLIETYAVQQAYLSTCESQWQCG